LLHLGQLIHQNKFQDYDGYEANLLYYHSWSPPKFDVKKVKNMPIALFAGMEDPLGTVTDTNWLNSQLGNVVHYEKVENMDHGFTLAGPFLSEAPGLNACP
jgi:hypothetical protein